MRLSLAGWPPVASHATCLLAGLALAHLTEGQSAEGPRFPPQVVIFTLKGKPISDEDSGKNIRPGTKMVVTKTFNSVSCRLHDSALDVLAVDPNLVLALPVRDPHLSSVIAFLRDKSRQKAGYELTGLNKPKQRLELAAKASPMPLCHGSPTVIYD